MLNITTPNGLATHGRPEGTLRRIMRFGLAFCAAVGVLVVSGFGLGNAQAQTSTLTFTREISATSIAVGETVTLTYKITNAGTAEATNLKFRQFIPVGLTFVNSRVRTHNQNRTTTASAMADKKIVGHLS